MINVDDELQNDTNLICDCLGISPFSNVHDPRRVVRRLMYAVNPKHYSAQPDDTTREGTTVTITFLQDQIAHDRLEYKDGTDMFCLQRRRLRNNRWGDIGITLLLLSHLQ